MMAQGDDDPGDAWDADAEAEILARREGDAKLRDQLASSGFAGPEYDDFVRALVRYARPILCAWLRMGKSTILRECMKRGVPGIRSVASVAEMYWPAEHEVEDLVQEILAKALPAFRRRALVEGGWQRDSGASLKTYFVGTCCFLFPEFYWKWKNAVERSRIDQFHAISYFEDVSRSGHDLGDDPLRRIIAKETLARNLPTNYRARLIVFYNALGYSHAEIAEILADGSSPRAVEGVLRRHREKRRGVGDNGAR